MPNFDHTSGNRLQPCHEQLITLFKAVIRVYDFRVMCGHRNEADQEAAFKAGTSPLHWPNSKHNKFPSQAVDILPNCLVVNGKINWNDTKAFEKAYKELSEIVFREAEKLNIKIKWGGHFPRIDLPHFELVL